MKMLNGLILIEAKTHLVRLLHGAAIVGLLALVLEMPSARRVGQGVILSLNDVM